MSIGVWQVILILLIVLIIFGAGKLPKVMGDVAKGVKNFKQGMKDEPEGSTTNKAIAQDETEPVSPAPSTKDETAKG